MSSDNAQSAVTYTSISSNSDGPSWGIQLMNAGELLEIDPYEEVVQQGQAHPLSPAYVSDFIELDEHVQRIQAAQDKKKSYADLKQKPMEFEVRDKVMLKVSSWKGVVRFGKRGKLNPRYVRPFKVSNLKKCYADERLVMPLEGIHVDDKLQFVQEHVKIMEQEIKRLKRSQIPMVK
nr:putative reverse transcriptase domain-containing protein [Tanacetum cinerariifolium]